jgi:hypothetical protein
MKSISQIPHDIIMKVTDGSFEDLPQLGKTGLLNDFQYVWLKQLQKLNYNFERLDLARMLCNSENRKVFKITNCKSINDIREKIKRFLLEEFKNDNRVIISLRYEKPRIEAEWVPLDEYQTSEKK